MFSQLKVLPLGDWRPSKSAWMPIPTAPETIPVAAMIAFATTGWLWNARAGIQWEPDLTAYLVLTAIPMLLALGYCWMRPASPVSEITLYLPLWMLFPIFTTRLTYLCVTIGYPLADPALLHADAALGFTWLQWQQFNQNHPLLCMAQIYLYKSIFWQPTVAVVIAAIWAPRTRNGELFIAVSVSIILTLGISTFFPAIGPADALGGNPAPGPIIRALQADPTAHSLPYVGIVSFPSFHAVLAVLLANAYRGMRWAFPVAVLVNGLMLLSTPLCGDHYLVDVFGGIIVASAGIVSARWLLRTLCHSDATMSGRYDRC